MTSKMRTESLQAPSRVETQLQLDQEVYTQLAQSLKSAPPQAIVTIARGSSDHAAQYLAYLIMQKLGHLVTSLPMSLVTLHASKIRCEGLLSMAFSQSGQSPDLISPTDFFQSGGARTVAFVNQENSPLFNAVKYAIPLHAGAEESVAATKSYIAQLTAGARLLSLWSEEGDLFTGLQQLPQTLERATQQNWDQAIHALQAVNRLFVVSRGAGLAIAHEIALKFKETCGIQAEAFSGAEVKHGPMAIIDTGYPLLILAPRGPAQAGLIHLAQEMRERGAQVLLVAPQETEGFDLPFVAAKHPDLVYRFSLEKTKTIPIYGVMLKPRRSTKCV